MKWINCFNYALFLKIHYSAELSKSNSLNCLFVLRSYWTIAGYGTEKSIIGCSPVISSVHCISRYTVTKSGVCMRTYITKCSLMQRICQSQIYGGRLYTKRCQFWYQVRDWCGLPASTFGHSWSSSSNLCGQNKQDRVYSCSITMV